MLYFQEPDRIWITLGVVDGGKTLDLHPSAHIFLEDKPAWVSVPDDGAGQYQKFSTEVV
jgi:hypothetical protein